MNDQQRGHGPERAPTCPRPQPACYAHHALDEGNGTVPLRPVATCRAGLREAGSFHRLRTRLHRLRTRLGLRDGEESGDVVA
ncbi:hypothetical protein SAMN02982918_3908 [Saccharomonospora viridis]|nr:hypothetical protein SAMN02982918_3908 [Saccharomonospora viridis]